MKPETRGDALPSTERASATEYRALLISCHCKLIYSMVPRAHYPTPSTPPPPPLLTRTTGPLIRPFARRTVFSPRRRRPYRVLAARPCRGPFAGSLGRRGLAERAAILRARGPGHKTAPRCIVPCLKRAPPGTSRCALLDGLARIVVAPFFVCVFFLFFEFFFLSRSNLAALSFYLFSRCARALRMMFASARGPCVPVRCAMRRAM